MYIVLARIPGKGHSKVLTAGIGWASAEVLIYFYKPNSKMNYTYFTYYQSGNTDASASIMVRSPRRRIRLEIHPKMPGVQHLTRPAHHNSNPGLAMGSTRSEQKTSADSDSVVNFHTVQKFTPRNIDFGDDDRTLDGAVDQIGRDDVRSDHNAVRLHRFGASARHILNAISIQVTNNCDW